MATSGVAEGSVAWLSLDEGDAQPGLFWTYVISALRTVVPGIGAGALALLRSARPPVDTALTLLLNEFSSRREDVHLVLDDYHLVDGPGIEAGLVFLLEHLPPHVHLVISSRADPALPLARLRARGELVEVRAAELRFTLDEVTGYLNEVVGLRLAATDIATLEGRTEGWIAALQLAGLSLRGRADVPGFIAGFAGDDRYIVDYLVEEVLGRQSEPVRSFLIETSILDRLSGPLCDAVTARPGGAARLEALERANVLLVPLDDSRRWYRYHRLFADVLQTRLREAGIEVIQGLHRRASRWYDENGEPVPAVRHALAAGDVERAAGLVELAIPALLRHRQELTIRGWRNVIPPDLVHLRPVLAVGFIGALTSLGEFDGVAERLDDVERVLADPPTDLVVLDEYERGRLPGQIEMYRAALALVGGDTAATIGHADLALDRAAADDHLTRAGASALVGLASWSNGDLDAAHRAYSVTVDGLRRVGHLSDLLGCSIALADIRLTQGLLDEARQTYEDALRLTSTGPGPPVRGTADMYVGLSTIAFERDDRAGTSRYLARAEELGDGAGLPQNPYRRRVSQALVAEAHGDHERADRLLSEARRVYLGDFSPDVRPVAALAARLRAAHGHVGEALRWVRERGLSVDEDVSYLREYEHVTLARVLLASGADDHDPTPDARPLLQRLLAAAEAGQRTGSVIEILIVQALTHRARGDATAALDRAVALAEPEGYVRVFVGEGPPMVALLTALAKKRPGRDHVRRLLLAAGPVNEKRGLIDPLSERELEVLRLLKTDLDGPAIARRLVVSLSTVRTHTRSIYTKFGVTSRRAAVRQAEELDL